MISDLNLLLPLNRCCNTLRSIKHGPFVAPDLARPVAEVSAIAELRIVHWQCWKTWVIAFCALRKQRCEIVYCGPQKHTALPLPTSGNKDPVKSVEQ